MLTISLAKSCICYKIVQPPRFIQVEGSIDSQEKEGASSYGNKEKGWSNYASGIDGTTIRAVLRKAGHEGWCCSSTDVRTAFLLAPRQNQNGVLIVKPPQILREAGLVGPQDLWKVDKALYGLQSSPSDWGLFQRSTIGNLDVDPRSG